MSDVNRRVLPGFGLSLGYASTYMGLLIMLPIAAVLVKSSSLGWEEFVSAAWSSRAQAAYALTLGASFVAALVNIPFGILIAWVLVRYEFPGRRVLDAIIDLPFALPTAVAGLVYSSLYVAKGWFGRFLVPLGIQGAYSRLAIVLVLTFIGLPFIVRAVQPVLADLEAEVEEAAACLGATRLQTFWRVLLPILLPATVTGFALAFARGIGEYGSVVFVSGNMPFKTEIAPVLVVASLESFHYADAAAIAVVMLAMSFSLLFAINILERWTKRHGYA
ncbi:sulfate ABC transporter permease subunit CysT [bacterium]|nr:sulfate ABC transporter permease subunit CysT [bacterium]